MRVLVWGRRHHPPPSQGCLGTRPPMKDRWSRGWGRRFWLKRAKGRGVAELPRLLPAKDFDHPAFIDVTSAVMQRVLCQQPCATCSISNRLHGRHKQLGTVRRKGGRSAVHPCVPSFQSPPSRPPGFLFPCVAPPLRLTLLGF